jgi:hypothetical protein
MRELREVLEAQRRGSRVGLSRAEAEAILLRSDRALYGVSYVMNGRRVDPSRVHPVGHALDTTAPTAAVRSGLLRSDVIGQNPPEAQ